MHSSETLPAVAATSGPQLLLQLGRLIIRSRSASPAPPPAPAPRDRLLHAKLLASKPSTSQQIQTQPKPEAEEQKPGVEAQLSNHVQALWNDQIPVCIDVLLAADCAECRRIVSRGEELSFDRHTPRALLLERWTMKALHTKAQGGTGPAFMTSQWLLNAVRSQLHFSQLSAWRATLTARDPAQRRRKLSRETCNIKKIEANCDEDELGPPRRLHVVYSIRVPADHAAAAAPHGHAFPVTDIGNDVSLKVVLETLPRLDEIPTVRCICPKRRTSKETPVNLHEELTGKLNDLTLGGRTSKFPTDLAINSNTGNGTRRLSIVTNAASTEYLYTTDEKDKKLLDDRMHTTCSENGKHKCNCDEESDGRDNRSSSSINEPKKLDERRLKEIAKYKRRLRKESKMKKLCDSTSSEGDVHQKAKETHTSIPILQAARFDRFRAIGCYRNQTYLTLPASRIESKSPFVEAVSIPHVEIKRTCSVSTQTEDLSCPCGAPLDTKCDDCNKNRLVRSDGNYDLAALDCRTNGARRKCEEAGNVLKKHKCDNNSSYLQCDNVLDSSSISDVIKRPSLRRYFPIVDRLEKIVADRSQKDMEELHLDKDDAAFFVPKPESKRQKTYSVNEDYVFYEKCDYGTFEKCESDRVDSPIDQNGFKFPEVKKGQENQVPSPSEMDKFRWRFDSAASMVFHRKTGLPLTSSPAPLRRGNNCFDFDDSINGISGIKSALFHPIAAVAPAPSPPLSPASAAPAPRPHAARTPPAARDAAPKLKMGPSTGLLGSFEESALQGRLEPVATVAGFSAELGASGALCPPHRRLPVTVFFYAPGGTNAPYMGHINLGPSGYRVPRSGTVQVSLFNPHGTLVKMFVVLYDLTRMPPRARTFLRQRTLYLPARAKGPPQQPLHKWLRYLIHLRFMTSKSGKLYLHTDIRIIVSRKADLDTATAHSLFRPIANEEALDKDESATSHNAAESERATSRPNRVFGGSSEHDSEVTKEMREIGYENQNGVAYELRSFTYAPENPKYSPR